MDRRNFLKTVGLGTAALSVSRCGFFQKGRPRRPHVIFVMADDMGWGDVGIYNPDSMIPTPNIDRLAGEGVRFTDAHSGGSLCTPTRYGIMTGRYYWRTYKKHALVMPYDPPVIPSERLTWAEVMREGGYATEYIGKWHLGLWYPSLRLGRGNRQYTMIEDEIDFNRALEGGPCDLGFDYFFGTAGCSTSDAPYAYIENEHTVGIPSEPSPKEYHELPGFYPGRMVPGWEIDKVDMTLTEKAVDRIDRHMTESPEKPLFLYVALSTPHIPWIPPEFIQGASREGPRGDMCALADWCLGEVRRALERNGVLDDTMLIFTSDNGPRRGANGHLSAGPYRGFKNSAYEGGSRVPFIVRWAGETPPGAVVDEPVGLNDMTATFAGFLGRPLPDNAAEDSFDILPLIRGRGSSRPRRPLLIADTGGHTSDFGDFALRRGNWKLVELQPRPSGPRTEIQYELYDMGEDPYETRDLSAARPDVLDEMLDWLRRAKATGLRFLT